MSISKAHLARTLLSYFLLSLAGVGISLAGPAASPATQGVQQAEPIAGRYIVVFKESARGAIAADVMQGRGGTVHHAYSHALHGFSATLTDASLQSIRKHPLVAYVEQDQIFHVAQVQSPESSPDWGLDRIDQTDLPLDNQYYFNRTGSGVYAFIIDTGIRSTHSDFTGRVLEGQNFVPFEPNVDLNGHGTHVAGTVGGMTYGVAKGVSLVPVKVLDSTEEGP